MLACDGGSRCGLAGDAEADLAAELRQQEEEALASGQGGVSPSKSAAMSDSGDSECHLQHLFVCDSAFYVQGFHTHHIDICKWLYATLVLPNSTVLLQIIGTEGCIA